MLDVSVAGGLRGQLPGGALWDASVNAGSSEADFFIFDTVNASLGPATPTEFDPGLYRQDEVGANLDLSYGLTERINLAGGAEWRDERFTIGLGEPASWQIGPYAPQGFSAGSNGFPGFSPIAAGAWSRAHVAAYGDVEVRGMDEAWTAGGALRLENYEDFGATLNGKLSGRYRLSTAAALRASISRGFRAPTPGQQNAFNVSTEFDRELLDLVNNGTIPSTSAVARLRGGAALEPERSVNHAAGRGHRRGTVQPDRRLLPHPPVRPAGTDAALRSAPRRGGRTDRRRGDQRAQPAELPLLHEPLRDADAGGGPGRHLHAAGAGGADAARVPLQSDRHPRYPLRSGGARRRPDPRAAGKRFRACAGTRPSARPRAAGDCWVG